MRVDVSGELQALSAISPKQETPVPTGQKLGWHQSRDIR
jgi:hypothetical protein